MIQLCTLVIFLYFKFFFSCLLFDLRLRLVAYTVLNGLGDAFIFPEFEHHFFSNYCFQKLFSFFFLQFKQHICNFEWVCKTKNCKNSTFFTAECWITSQPIFQHTLTRTYLPKANNNDKAVVSFIFFDKRIFLSFLVFSPRSII